MDDIEFQVRTFVAEFCRMKSIDECPLDARVNHDLGIGGDDAEEFFDAFATQFGTDLKELRQAWDTHFRSEYAEIHDWKRMTITAVVAFASAVLGFTINVDGWRLFFICMIGSFLGFLVANYFFPFGKSNKRALTIAQMVEAARLGHRPKHENGTSEAPA